MKPVLLARFFLEAVDFIRERWEKYFASVFIVGDFVCDALGSLEERCILAGRCIKLVEPSVI